MSAGPVIVGVRREDRNPWERRVPLVPGDAARLQAQGVALRVQPSPRRVFDDAAYAAAGVAVAEDLSPCRVVLAVKEIPLTVLAPHTTWVCFAHVIKGQAYNMPLLAALLDRRCTLVDYERIRDAHGRRLIYFSVHAGYAGTIDTLWTLGQRLARRGIATPFAEVRRAWEYPSLEDAKAHLRAIAERLDRELPAALRPLVIGVTGEGNVARGCREILACLTPEWVAPAALAAAARRSPAAPAVRCVVFREEHMAAPIAAAGGAAGSARDDFDLAHYYAHPERYEGTFEAWLPSLDVLLNAIYWEPRYPRLVTRDWVRRHPEPRLQVIGDISCDIEGSVEITLEATTPDAPSYTWDAVHDTVRRDLAGPGPAVMAVDNLPCELARESSEHFSQVLSGMVPALAACDWSAPVHALDLPPPLKGAVVTHQGALAPDYAYLARFLPA